MSGKGNGIDGVAHEWCPGMMVCHKEFVPAFCVRLVMQSPTGDWFSLKVPCVQEPNFCHVVIMKEDCVNWKKEE